MMLKKITFVCFAALMLALFVITQVADADKAAGAAPASVLPAADNLRIFLPVVMADPGSQPVGQAFTFLAWADTKSGLNDLAALSKQARPFDPVFSFYMGDLEEDGFTKSGASTWTNALNGSVNNGLSAITFPQRGNHDIANPSGWQAYFNTRATAAAVRASHFDALDEDLTYAFEYGNTYFIGLDVPGDASLITSRQLDYLDRGLTGAENRGLTHAFLFLHGPIYMINKSLSCMERICPLSSQVIELIRVLNRHPIVSAIFAGHEHLLSYTHLDSSRIPEITHPIEQFISGSAGAELHPCYNYLRYDMCRSENGFTIITVKDRTFTVNVYVQGQAEPVNTYTITKK